MKVFFIYNVFTKVGSEVAKKAASEGAKKALEKAGIHRYLKLE